MKWGKHYLIYMALGKIKRDNAAQPPAYYRSSVKDNLYH